MLKVNFGELYARHLCRHSEYGINVNHLVSVIGSYLGLFALAFALLPSWWLIAALALPYLILLAFNVPARVFAACSVFLAIFFGSFYLLPALPIWAALILIVGSHYFQNLGHKIYTVERDMTEFNKKYKKGWPLAITLAFYELPILLNYLVFNRTA